MEALRSRDHDEQIRAGVIFALLDVGDQQAMAPMLLAEFRDIVPRFREVIAHGFSEYRMLPHAGKPFTARLAR